MVLDLDFFKLRKNDHRWVACDQAFLGGKGTPDTNVLGSLTAPFHT